MPESQELPKNPTGRPSDYSDELADAICERIAEGESLRDICSEDDMPDKRTVLRWLRKEEYKDFRTQYAHAREQQADEFLELMSEIADDDSNDTQPGAFGQVGNAAAVSRSKLRIDNLRWRMEKQAPKKYGTKLVDVTSGGDKLPANYSKLSDSALEEVLNATNSSAE
jgi:hypothetical protein